MSRPSGPRRVTPRGEPVTSDLPPSPWWCDDAMDGVAVRRATSRRAAGCSRTSPLPAASTPRASCRATRSALRATRCVVVAAAAVAGAARVRSCRWMMAVARRREYGGARASGLLGADELGPRLCIRRAAWRAARVVGGGTDAGAAHCSGHRASAYSVLDLKSYFSRDRASQNAQSFLIGASAVHVRSRDYVLAFLASAPPKTRKGRFCVKRVRTANS